MQGHSKSDGDPLPFKRSSRFNSLDRVPAYITVMFLSFSNGFTYLYFQRKSEIVHIQECMIFYSYIISFSIESYMKHILVRREHFIISFINP